MAALLNKLSMLKRFSDLDLTNVELNTISIENLCYLLESSSSISALAIGGTHIGVDGTLKLSGSLAKLTTKVTILDMSFCGIDPYGGSKFFEDLILHENLVQLNLSGNRLENRGAYLLGHLVAKARCHLRILMLNGCHLGKNGILKIIQSLSENSYLEELGVAGNNSVENNTVLNVVTRADKSSTEECGEEVVNSKEYDNGAKGQISQSLHTGLESNLNEMRAHVGNKTENTEERGLQNCCRQLERNRDEYDVADSEDEARAEGVNRHTLEDDRASSSQSFELNRNRSLLLLGLQTNENVLIRREANAMEISFEDYASELCSAIQMAKILQLLDLSDNLLPSEIVEQLYVAWSSNTRKGIPAKHVDNQVVHFSMEGRQCCGIRPCCRRIT